MDFSNAGAKATLDWVLGDAVTPPAQLFIQLHIGDPGADGTANPAVENTREEVTFGPSATVSTDGRAQTLTDSDVTWVTVAATESYSHISIWDAATVGVCWYKGAMVAPVAVAAGSNFTFPLGSKLDHA